MRQTTMLGACAVILASISTACSSQAPADPVIPNNTAGSSGAASGGQSGAGGATALGGQSGGGAGGFTSGGASGAGGEGTAGTGGASGSAGAAGTAGTGGGTSGPYDVPRGKSAGCNMVNLTDQPGEFTQHDLAIPGVDPAFIAAHADNTPTYDYEFRNYFIRLPVGYDPAIAYPIVFGGGGCGGGDGLSGKDGGWGLVPDEHEDKVIRVGLSYVWSGGACFEDGWANTPDVPYFDAVYADIIAKNCVDLEKVFIGGYSSGAWLAYTMSLARGGVIRGMAAGAGGIREEHPPRADIPFAMIGVTGLSDEGNPIHDTKDGTSCGGTEADGCWNGAIICGFAGAEDCVDEGSAAARDHILELNGCVGDATEQYGEWADCKKYTGCPAEFPVVYCMPEGGHTDGGDRIKTGAWDLWMNLPPIP